MLFPLPLSSADRLKVDPDDLDISLQLHDLTQGNRALYEAFTMESAGDFQYAYTEYRLNGAGTAEELTRLADLIKEDFGPNQGAEAVRIIVKAVDNAIAEQIGAGCRR